MKLMPILFLTMTLVGCTTVGPDYQRPETALPDAWRSELPAEEHLVDSQWWKAFADPVLSGLVDQALLGNRDLLLATARVDQYLAVLDTTRSQFFPQAGYALGANRQDNASTPLSATNPPAYTTLQASLNISWELDLWGRIRRADEAARAQLLATEEERRAVLVSLVSKVASTYITLRGYDQQLEIAHETQQLHAETRRLFRLRHRHGTISGIELKQIESQYENAAQTIPQLQALIARQEHLLSILLGENPQGIPRGKEFNDFRPPALPKVLPLSLLDRRPDIRQAEYQLIAANARIGEAKALYFPTISLSGLLGRQSADLSDLFRSGGGFWSFGGSAQLNLIQTKVNVHDSTIELYRALAGEWGIVVKLKREGS